MDDSRALLRVSLRVGHISTTIQTSNRGAGRRPAWLSAESGMVRALASSSIVAYDAWSAYPWNAYA